MVQHPEPKKAVGLIRNTFANKGVTLKTKEAYELLAQLWGYPDWATCQGLTKKQVPAAAAATVSTEYGRKESDLAGWHRWVVSNRDGEDGEALWLLPPGATLEDRITGLRWDDFVEDGDALELVSGFSDEEARKTYQDLVVATAVACQFPRADRYGYPMQANEREVHTWLQQDMGWGYLIPETGVSRMCPNEVEVYASESGDDTSAVWWAEILVAPQVHTRLLALFEPRPLALD